LAGIIIFRRTKSYWAFELWLNAKWSVRYPELLRFRGILR